MAHSGPTAQAAESEATPEEASPLGSTGEPANETTHESADEPTEVTITARRSQPSGAHMALLAREAAQTAGSLGDAAKVVTSLPGVARASGQGEPVVWGSSPHETGIFLDRVPLPMLFHGSALRSIVPTSLLSTVRLTPGAYGVELGRYTGGVLELTTLDEAPLSSTLVATVDALDASAALAVPLTLSSGARLGARYGYVDRWLPTVLGAEVAQLYTVPSYWDAHATFHVELANGDLAKVVALTSHDEAQRKNAWASYATQRSTTRLYASYEHTRFGADGFTTRTRVVPFLGYDQNAAVTSSYDTQSSTELTTCSLGLRVDATLDWGTVYFSPSSPAAPHAARRVTSPSPDSLQLNVGVDARADVIDAAHRGSLTVPPREGDVQVFGLPPGRDYVADDVAVTRAAVAPYVELDLDWAPLRLTPGVRFETTATELERALPSVNNLPATGATRFTSAWLPRLGVDLAASRNVRWFGAVSRHVQAPDALELGTLVGNPQLPNSEATHVVLGETTQLSDALSVQVLAFRKWLTHLAVRTPNPFPAPARLLTDAGRGDVWGSQIFVRWRPTAGWSGWLGVTISRSRRQDDDGTWRRFDYDQPLAATLVLNKSIEAWSFGSRLRASSGFPRPVIASTYYDLQLGRFVPVTSSARGWRLPPFFAVDLRAERRLSLGNAGAVYVYAEVLNVTNHDNVEEVAYSSDYTTQTFLRGLPLLAFLGVRTEL